MAYQPAGSGADRGSGCGRECGATTNTCKPGAKAKQQSASEKRASVKTQQSAALHSGAKRSATAVPIRIFPIVYKYLCRKKA